jgi:hypothetical protein
MASKDVPLPFDGELGLDSGLDHQDPDAYVHREEDHHDIDPDTDEEDGARGLRTGLRLGTSATAWARSITSWHPSGMCQQFSRTAFGVGAYYGSAALAWRMAKYKHPTSNTYGIPAGVPVFWTGGSRGYGHVAVSLGNGLCRSTDWTHRYQVSTARIADIHRSSGHQFAGWTEDINRVRVYVPRLDSAAGPLRVHLANLKPDLKNNDVRDLQKALRRHTDLRDLNPSGVTGVYGDETRAMIRRFQRQQGWTGGDADGLIGPNTCRLLGLKVV